MIAKNKRPKIGILSGVGPVAGSDVLRRVYEYSASKYGAVEDEDYPDLLLLNHGISGVGNTADISDLFEQEIIKGVKELELAGANIIGIACNTAHLFIDKIELEASSQIVDLIDAVSKKAGQSDHEYTLFCSSSSRHNSLYDKSLDKYGVRFSNSSANQQEQLDEVILEVMKHDLKSAAQRMSKLIEQANSSGSSGIIAACTELPVAIARSKEFKNQQIIDSNQVLAEELVDRYFLVS